MGHERYRRWPQSKAYPFLPPGMPHWPRTMHMQICLAPAINVTWINKSIVELPAGTWFRSAQLAVVIDREWNYGLIEIGTVPKFFIVIRFRQGSGPAAPLTYEVDIDITSANFISRARARDVRADVSGGGQNTSLWRLKHLYAVQSRFNQGTSSLNIEPIALSLMQEDRHTP